MPPAAMSLAVVGAKHKNADGSDRELEIEACAPGEPVELVPEPENEHDPHAIAVFSERGVQLGYISAERAPRIGSFMAEHDIIAVFQRPSEFGAWIRASFDGEPPVLTPAMLIAKDEEPPSWGEQHGEPDFYPDEIWPDD
jgi:hypothetical protein